MTTQYLLSVIAFDSFKKDTANTTRNFLIAPSDQLAANDSTTNKPKKDIYGINFTNLNGMWYTQTQLNTILQKA